MDTDTNTSSRGTYDWQVPRQPQHSQQKRAREQAGMVALITQRNSVDRSVARKIARTTCHHR